MMRRIAAWLWMLAALPVVVLAASGMGQAVGRPAAKLTYVFYATDGQFATGAGAAASYGLIGGRAGSPAQVVDAQGQSRTIEAGWAVPVSGPRTAFEEALVGQAQPAPLIVAGAGDLVEVRLKNLGIAKTGEFAPAVALEFKDPAILPVAAVTGTVLSDAQTMALPAVAGEPASGNVLVYAFTAPVAGKYAYTLVTSGHADDDMVMSMGGTMTCMCPCCRAMRAAMSATPGMADMNMAGMGSAMTAMDMSNMGLFATLAVAVEGFFEAREQDAASRDPAGGRVDRAPENDRIRSLQANTPFQVLVPAYLPSEFDRSRAEVQKLPVAGGAAVLQVTYRSPRAAVFVTEWLAQEDGAEALAGSTGIDTKWGEARARWDAARGFTMLMADVGATRVSISSAGLAPLGANALLAILNTMGPASQKRVTHYGEPVAIRPAPTPRPVEAVVGADSVQEQVLIATANGYSPSHFSVTQGIKTRLVFRSLGEPGCTGTLVFAPGTPDTVVLSLESLQDRKTLEFTPSQAGAFPFRCEHDIYHGVMTVD